MSMQHPICSLVSWSVSLHEFGNQKSRDGEIWWVQSVPRNNISSSFPLRSLISITAQQLHFTVKMLLLEFN